MGPWSSAAEPPKKGGKLILSSDPIGLEPSFRYIATFIRFGSI
jgi:hypothetical protein